MDMKMNKKGQTQLIVIVLLILSVGTIAVLAVTGNINLADITQSCSASDGYIQVPYIPFLKCDLSGTTRDYTLSIPSVGGDWVQIPENTNGYSVRLMSEKVGVFSSNRRFEYYICPQKGITTNCIHKITDDKSGAFDVSLGQIASGSYVWAEYQGACLLKVCAKAGATYQVVYQPYTLQRTDVLRGSGEILGSEGCHVPDAEWAARLTATFEGKPAPTSRDLQPNQVFNYFSGTITRIASGNLEANGKYCIYSNGVGTLYPVVQLNTASGCYNVVDVNNGNAGIQDCCSGDDLPDKTCVKGKWVSTVNAECDTLNPCKGPDWNPEIGTDKTVIRYNCVNSKCVAQTKTVDCNKDSDCAATNLRCNLNTFKCEVASVGVNTPGTTVLATDETTCVKDGNTWIPKTTTKKCPLFGLLPIGCSTNVVEAHCEDKTTNWLLWFSIILVIIILLLIFGKKLGALVK